MVAVDEGAGGPLALDADSCPQCSEKVTQFQRTYATKLLDGKYQILDRLGVGGMGEIFLGKALALLAFGRLSGIRPGGAGMLSIALLPMSGLAVVMVQDTAFFYPAFGAELAAIMLSAIALLELAGPLATQFALRRAGEARPDG